LSASAIEAVCASLGLRPTVGQTESLLGYLALLQHWNVTYNLTSVRDPAAMFALHLVDCLAVVKPLLKHAVRGRLLDVGSGGGLPGVVVAIMAPSFDVTCVDSVGKKVAFLRDVGGALALSNLHAEQTRVEDLHATPFDVITARAFGSLDLLARLTQKHLTPRGVWLAMKGQVPLDEISTLSASVEAFHVEQLEVPGLHAQRCLVWMCPKTTA
jgi:16S rRNA (guanine527-N7)-methyltransferase